MIYTNSHNPILPLEHHIPDGEAHVMPDGKLYVYGSYDAQDEYYCSDVYHVASTADMQNWEVHGIALCAGEIPWFGDPAAPHYPGVDWEHPTPFVQKTMPDLAALSTDPAAKEKLASIPPLLYAPDCAYKDGKYYLYFCMSDESEGVAVAESPVGPFQHPVQLPCGGIDPAVFVDKDGSAYYYWGQFSARGVKLNEDMTSFDENGIVNGLVTEEEHFFHEGSSMRRIGDTYYYVFADIEHGKPTSLGYATGKSPLGPFTYRGVIIDNALCDSASWNNHGSIECFGGQWYIFYHRCSRGKQLYRRLCIEPITILPDGSIPEVKMTSQGPGEAFRSGETLHGYQACELHGDLYIAPDKTGSESLTHISNEDHAVFRYVKSSEEFRSAELRTKGQGHITLLLDGEAVGEADIVRDGTARIALHGTAGTGREQELSLCFTNVNNLTVYGITLFA